MSKIQSRFRKREKQNWENLFYFWDNCIWSSCKKLSLLRREYLSSGVNVIRNNPKTLHTLRETFSNWTAFTVIKKYGKGALV